MITGKGKLVQCLEDMEIVQQVTKRKKQVLEFFKDVYYTALLEDKIAVIDRKHKAIELPQDLFIRHFKIV